jgi:hypothetical protein
MTKEERYEQFTKDMDDRRITKSKHYDGRNYYQGPSVTHRVGRPTGRYPLDEDKPTVGQHGQEWADRLSVLIWGRVRGETMKRRMNKSKSDATPKYILNPEYLRSEGYASELELTKCQLAGMGECVEDYFPEDYGKALPEEGAWIMLLMSVHVGKLTTEGKTEHVTVPHLSMWFALPTVSPSGCLDLKKKKAIIQTPQGEVHIWPHEYTVVKDLSKYLDMTEEEGFYINFMSETEGFDMDKLLYIQSRGIPKGTAQRMLLPELKDPYFCYFTFHPAYSEAFGEGFGSPYLTTTNHERRRQSRKRREAA